MHRLLHEPTTRLSSGDFCRLPDDGLRYEIVDGVLLLSPSPETAHQRVLLSPTRPAHDARIKRKAYARCGVRYYWLIDPLKRTFTELELRASKYVKANAARGQDSVRTRVFPKLAQRLGEIRA